MKSWVLLSIALLPFLDAPLVRAQAVLDQRVGLNDFEQPLIVTQVDGQTIGTLAKAAGVPMGFEGLLPRRDPLSIHATNKPLRDVLDAIVAADARYAWREVDGVILVRPVDAWNNETSWLNTRVGGMALNDVAATELFGALTRMVGVSVTPSQGLGDTKRFSVDIPSDGTLLHALNAIVRAHGTLTWVMQPSSTSDKTFPTSLTLFIGSTGVGFGIPASASVSNIVSVSDQPSVAEKPLRFDRIVGPRGDGQPLMARGVGWSVKELATAVGVPMGLEWLPPAERQVVMRPGFDGIRLTGMTLQNALATLIALDPRYEWRDLNGVIVFRPVVAWLEPSNPLFRSVEGLRLDRTTTSKAIGVVTSLLGAPEHALNGFPDTRAFSLDFPQGSVLDLLNAIARSHGELCWEWEELTADDSKVWSGRRYSVSFAVLGGGRLGFAIP